MAGYSMFNSTKYDKTKIEIPNVTEFLPGTWVNC